jgi:hypothetical protein
MLREKRDSLSASRQGQLYNQRRKGRRLLLFGLMPAIVRNVRRSDRSARPTVCNPNYRKACARTCQQERRCEYPR